MADWPQPGHSLLRSGPDWETEALLDPLGDWFLSYAFGYKVAADAVVERVGAKEASPETSLITSFVQVVCVPKEGLQALR